MGKRNIIIPALVSALLFTVCFADRAHEIAKTADLFSKANASCLAPEKSSAASGVELSPSLADTGDLYLNFLKKQSTLPDFPPEKFLTEADFQKLSASIPQGLDSKNHTRFAEPLADLGEGNIYGLTGYLYYASTSAPFSPSAEHNHKELNHNDTETGADYLLVIGFDGALAAGIKAGRVPSNEELSRKSVVAEMTPEFRSAGSPAWSIPLLAALLGRPVKLTGQLILDNSGLTGPVLPPDPKMAPQSPLPCWKIRPVTGFYITKSDTMSPPDSADWKTMEEIMKE